MFALCVTQGEHAVAVELLALMPKVGVLPNRHCFNATIAACEKHGAWLDVTLAFALTGACADVRSTCWVFIVAHQPEPSEYAGDERAAADGAYIEWFTSRSRAR